MFDRILVICTGNICRSPFGEMLLKELCPEKEVSSAGIGALVGYPADKLAVEVARQFDINLAQHQGRQLTRKHCSESDLILVMEEHHRQYIGSIAPEAIGKTMLFGHWLEDQKINDPYKQSEDYFRLIFSKIQEAAILWQKRLG